MEYGGRWKVEGKVKVKVSRVSPYCMTKVRDNIAPATWSLLLGLDAAPRGSDVMVVRTVATMRYCRELCERSFANYEEALAKYRSGTGVLSAALAPSREADFKPFGPSARAMISSATISPDRVAPSIESK